MKQIITLFSIALIFGIIFSNCDSRDPNITNPQSSSTTLEKEKKNKGDEGSDCVTIQSGTLLASDGSTITTGFDDWGYNYQAHLFNGTYCDAYRDAAWCQPYADVNLSMKWNDAWISNMDCNDDGLLDRHRGFDTYIGSGAWLTNHQSGEYEQDGKICKWTYFTKIVAAPAGAYVVEGVWFNADGGEIGPVIWGEFATIQTVENDPCAGINGVQYKSPAGPGFGKYQP